jgi:hypothetical protein
MLTRLRPVLIALLAAVALAGASTPAAAGDGCAWRKTTVVYHDPAPVQVAAQSDAIITEQIPSDLQEFAGWLDTLGGTMRIWRLSIALDADPWAAEGEVYGVSTAWGCLPRAGSSGGNATWRIERIATCALPSEDIEVSVRQTFDMTATCSGTGELAVDCHVQFWCARTMSSHRPGAVFSKAAGDVSVTTSSSQDHDEETCAASDDGSRGSSPEIVQTDTRLSVSTSMAAKTRLTGGVRDTRWAVYVLATCDGACQRIVPMIARNDFPPE